MCFAISTLSNMEIDRLVYAAQGKIFDFRKGTSYGVKALVKAHNEAIGCPLECVFFQLLSVCSHFMGPDCRVMVNEKWKEPAILWTVVLAEKGQKKSPALNRFLHPIQALESKLREKVVVEDGREVSEHDGDDGEMKQVYIEHFSMEELHYTLKRNDGRAVGLYDEISLLYERLDKYRNGSSDRKTLLSLINGGPWRRNFRNSQSVVEKTCFNMFQLVKWQRL